MIMLTSSIDIKYKMKDRLKYLWLEKDNEHK